LINYTIVSQIGQGSEAQVFKAVHNTSNKEVAIKQYNLESRNSSRSKA